MCAHRRTIILPFERPLSTPASGAKENMRVDVSIRIKGHLDPDLWQDYLAGLRVAHEVDGVSRLRGTLPDQPALYGVLRTLASLNLALLSVETDGCGAVPSINQKEKSMRKVAGSAEE
jgi:hypothetical protein